MLCPNWGCRHATLNPVFDTAAARAGWQPSKAVAPVSSAGQFARDGGKRTAYSTVAKEEDRVATANPLFDTDI